MTIPGRRIAMAAGMAAMLAALRSLVLPAVLPLLAFMLAALAWSAALAVAIWLGVGLLRAARQASRAGAVWAAGAVVLAGVLVLAALAGADLRAALERARDMPGAHAVIRPLGGGTALLFDGYIDQRSVPRLEAAARAMPGLRTIHLNGIGGDLGQSRRLRDFIRAGGWDTYVSGICFSGCVIAYLGGRTRRLEVDARMGFHSASVPWPFGDADAANAEIAAEMAAWGVDPGFARAAWRRHDPMWFPPAETLRRARLVDIICRHGAGNGCPSPG